jgi:predicted RNA-binding Zn-ribbon protein involved in translation (DUF1610 family)
MSERLICLKCNSKIITNEHMTEYTGGGYADYWYEYECQNCGNIWRSEVKSDYS